ncbi:protein YciZ/DeoL [Kosakonia sp. Marseille-Q7440]
MAEIDVKQLAGRIDTVLDILVAGDYQSAIRNLEILKTELRDLDNSDQSPNSGTQKTPWEI